MTNKQIEYTIVIGSTVMFVGTLLGMYLYVRIYNKKIKEKQKQLLRAEMEEELKNFKFGQDKFKTTQRSFCRCLHESENGLPRTKHCARACRDQIDILTQRSKFRQ